MQNVTPIKQENPIKVTPQFGRLTTKGVEIFKNMNDVENAKAFLDGLIMQTDNDHVVIAGLLVLLDAIDVKIDAKLAKTSGEHPGDYINDLKTFLFSWTIESSQCADAYIEAVKSGDFLVENLIDKSEPQELKAVA